uniref:Secreted protein n=1 Tax=Macaca fascicularis TaxID=9541 RepID=A0A7N9CLQ5_MACFA
MSHHAWPLFFLFLDIGSHSVAQAGVQWRSLSSLQPPQPVPHHQLGSRDSPASASQVAGTTSVGHHTWLIFVFSVETGFHYIAQPGLKLLSSK